MAPWRESKLPDSTPLEEKTSGLALPNSRKAAGEESKTGRRERWERGSLLSVAMVTNEPVGKKGEEKGRGDGEVNYA